MQQIVLVRYDEIALKKQPVRGRFEKTLTQNISQLLDIENKVVRDRGRILIKTDHPEEVAAKASRVPGVASSSPALKTNANIHDMRYLVKKVIRDSFKEKGTFAVRTKRTGSHEFSSQEINEEIGSQILNEFPDLSVDLDCPDQEIFMEIRGSDAYVFTRKIRGIGGLPVGTQKDSVGIFNGDKSSFAAIALMLKRGSLSHPILINVGLTNDFKKQLIEVASQLTSFHSSIKLRIYSLDRVFNKISGEAPEELTDIINSRAIMRFSEYVANELNAKAIIRGDSSTSSDFNLSGLKIIEDAVEVPVLHPLITFDYVEINEIMKDLRHFDFINEVHDFYSRVPQIDFYKLNIDKVRGLEESLSISDMLKQSLKSAEIHSLW